MNVVTCRLLVVGLVLLAVFLPLAFVPIAVFALNAPLVPTAVALAVSAHPPGAPLLVAASLRGPPSR